MNVLCFYKKKRLRENTIIGRNYDLECNGDATSRSRALFVLCPFCSAHFLFCALFIFRPFCCALIVRALFAAPKCRGSLHTVLSFTANVTVLLRLNDEFDKIWSSCGLRSRFRCDYGDFGFYEHSDITNKMVWSQGGHTKQCLLYPN